MDDLSYQRGERQFQIAKGRDIPLNEVPIVDLIIFDKDGVLLDLTSTWLPVARDITHHLSALTHHKVPATRFQDIIGINEETEQIDPDGLFAAGSFLDQQQACAAHAPELGAH